MTDSTFPHGYQVLSEDKKTLPTIDEPEVDETKKSPSETIQNWKIAYNKYRKIKSESQNLQGVGINDSRVPTGMDRWKPQDRKLFDAIKNIWIHPPSSEQYNLIDPSAKELSSTFNKNYIVDDILGHMVSSHNEVLLKLCKLTSQNYLKWN